MRGNYAVTGAEADGAVRLSRTLAVGLGVEPLDEEPEGEREFEESAGDRQEKADVDPEELGDGARGENRVADQAQDRQRSGDQTGPQQQPAQEHASDGEGRSRRLQALPEHHRAAAAGRAGGGRDAAGRRQAVLAGIAAAGVADPGEQGRSPDCASPGQVREHLGVDVRARAWAMWSSSAAIRSFRLTSSATSCSVTASAAGPWAAFSELGELLRCAELLALAQVADGPFFAPVPLWARYRPATRGALSLGSVTKLGGPWPLKVTPTNVSAWSVRPTQ